MSCNMVWLGCQKIQAQSQDQLVLTIECAEHVGQDTDPKESRKRISTWKEMFENKGIAGKKKFCIYITYILCKYICTMLEK